MSWKKLNSKKILDHPRLQVYEDTVELPNGYQTDYVYFKSGDSAMIIAVRDDGKIYVQEEYNYVIDKRLLEFPGGAANDGEDPKISAARELKEEAGLAGKLHLLGTFYADNRRKTQKMYVYVATEIQKTETDREDTEEGIKQFWHTAAEINDMVRQNKLENWSALAGWAMFTHSEFYRP